MGERDRIRTPIAGLSETLTSRLYCTLHAKSGAAGAAAEGIFIVLRDALGALEPTTRGPRSENENQALY